ncbi:MAG TPA: hypothetical protein DCE44_18410 [Verrucomicrobiales bacterium]|nr:hypothetical protein [Verrucomicrobiales bacterium]
MSFFSAYHVGRREGTLARRLWRRKTILLVTESRRRSSFQETNVGNSSWWSACFAFVPLKLRRQAMIQRAQVLRPSFDFE